MRTAILTLTTVLTAACAASPPSLPPPPRPPLEYIAAWGMRGDDPGHLSSPRCIGVDFAGSVYIADAGNRSVHKFDIHGRPLLSFSDSRIQDPQAIAVDSGEAIYVADAARNSVLIFFPDGKFLRELRGGPGRRFAGPVAIGLDSADNVYLLERAAARIQKFDGHSRFLRDWSTDDRGEGKSGLPADMAVGDDGFVYVVTDSDRRVRKFTLDGEFAGVWAASTSVTDPGGARAAIAVARGHLFLSWGARRSVEAFALDGTRLFSETLSARLAGAPVELTPAAIAVTPRGELLVLDSRGARVLRFHLNL